MAIPARAAHQQYRVAELMRSIAMPLQLGADPVEQMITRERTHQLVVALPPLMLPRD
jgi:hypothetical protein